jgi:ferritin heavy chain
MKDFLYLNLCNSSNYHEDNEGLINRQINLELYASYVYTAMAHHFDRFDVALKGKKI